MSEIHYSSLRNTELRNLQAEVDIRDHHIPLHVRKRIRKLRSQSGKVPSKVRPDDATPEDAA